MLNQITLMGRLTKDPELRYTNSNIPVASFTVAVDRDISTNDKKETDFINCVAWRNTGEFISKYFSKGNMISIIGRLQMRNFTDRNGNDRTVAEVVAEKAYFCGGKTETRQAPYVNTPDKPKATFIDVDDDDIPF